jgi:type IV pilus assembly protein PilA
MKSEFKAKLLQHVLSKKDSEKGFTLIELLVVIIIIGILAAIALPSFLNQSNKAKQGEAKTYVSSLNKGQQAHFTQKGLFVVNDADVPLLGLGIPTQTTNYVYNISGVTDNHAIGKAQPIVAALKGYAGRVQLVSITATSEVTSYTISCEENVPTNAAPGTPTTVGTPVSGVTCATGQEVVGK